jgi:AbrB family looped-hinge helix DNA binding protein
MASTTGQENRIMALVRLLRGGQVTLPAELRQKLQVKEGDYLEAEVVENGMLLKPVAFVSRERAWKAIREAQQGVRYIGPEPRPSPEDEEEQIYEIVREFREDHG